MLEPYTEYYDSDFVYVEAQKSYIIVLHDNSCYIQYFFYALVSTQNTTTTDKQISAKFEYKKKLQNNFINRLINKIMKAEYEKK